MFDAIFIANFLIKFFKICIIGKIINNCLSILKYTQEFAQQNFQSGNNPAKRLLKPCRVLLRLRARGNTVSNK